MLTGVGRLLAAAEVRVFRNVEIRCREDRIVLQRMHVIHAHALFACMKTETGKGGEQVDAGTLTTLLAFANAFGEMASHSVCYSRGTSPFRYWSYQFVCIKHSAQHRATLRIGSSTHLVADGPHWAGGEEVRLLFPPPPSLAPRSWSWG